MKRIDPQRYNQIVLIKTAVENDLLRLAGVTGVDVGYKEVNAEQTDEMAVLVFVRQKGVFDEGDRIPATVQGVKTDVIECEFHPLSQRGAVADAGSDVDSGRYSPLAGGCSVAPAWTDEWYGTLGVLVQDNGTGAQALLSNWHVFCDDPGWDAPGVDRRITQPATGLGGQIPADVIGNVYAAKLGQIVRPFAYDWYVDCAVCDLSGGRAAGASILNIGTLRGAAEPIVGELVRKRGATTLHTYGVLQSTNLTVVVPYPGVGNVTFYYQYRITAPDPSMPPFSLPGDSGSVIVDTEWNAVGLLFSGGSTPNGIKYTNANPMYMVLGALNLSLVTS